MASVWSGSLQNAEFSRSSKTKNAFLTSIVVPMIPLLHWLGPLPKRGTFLKKQAVPTFATILGQIRLSMTYVDRRFQSFSDWFFILSFMINRVRLRTHRPTGGDRVSTPC